jgi:uncharacterized protein YecT (DUF1311 family)
MRHRALLPHANRKVRCRVKGVMAVGRGYQVRITLDPEAPSTSNDYSGSPTLWYSLGFTEVIYYSAPGRIYAHHGVPAGDVPNSAVVAAPGPAADLDDSLGGVRSEAARTRADSLKLCDSSVTVDLANCALASNRDADDSLNTIYKTVVQLLRARLDVKAGDPDPDVVNQMRLAERAWIAFRDSECRWQDAWEEGTMWIPVRAGCYGSLVRERIRTLEAVRDQLEDGSR